MKTLKYLSFGGKKVIINGNYLRYKDFDESYKAIHLSKIISFNIDKNNLANRKLIWASLSFLLSLIIWFFLFENIFNTFLSIMSFLCATFFLLDYFVKSNYMKLAIKSNLDLISIEFPKNKIIIVRKFIKNIKEITKEM
jgi:hypothetical protein